LAVELELPAAWRVHPVFHVSLIRPAPTDRHPGQPPPPPRPGPIADAGDPDAYEVDKILDCRRTARGLRFRVQWAGWPIEEATDEPLQNVLSATDALRIFYAENPHKPRPPHLANPPTLPHAARETSPALEGGSVTPSPPLGSGPEHVTRPHVTRPRRTTSRPSRFR
jgi:hypothetical protein